MSKQTKIPVALILTDTHLHKNNVELVKDIFKQAIDLCKTLKINFIFHLGDFFTSREAQPLHVLDEAQDILMMVEEAKIGLDITDGNHDKVDLESNKSYLRIFYHNVTHKIDDVCNSFWYVNNKSFEKLNFIWVPYFKENGSYLKKLEEATKLIRKDKQNILLTHISINGVQNNDGSAVENVVKQELFKKFDKVLVGHYHQQQNINNIYYIGSAYQANFGEDEAKGFTIMYDDGSHDFIQSKFPKYIKEKIDIDDKNALKKFEKQYTNSKDHVRVVLTGDKTKLQAFNKENLYDKGIDVKFESEEMNSNFDISKQEIIMFDRSNIAKAFDKFIEINSIEDKEYGSTFLQKIL